jgi:uncharacterized SAM-binding protein YcdF (DUF218 family)
MTQVTTTIGETSGPATEVVRWWRKAVLCLAGFVVLLGGWVGWADWPKSEIDGLPLQAGAIVVLGGGAEERPRQAWKLFREGLAPKVVVTGDGGSIVRELYRCGLLESALIHETAATSTFENARNVAPLLADLGAKSAILVTTWSHAHRARRIFEREIPAVRFFVSSEPRPERLNQWERHYQRRERFAAIHHLFVHGLWCF